jgi:hypothetical protein
VATPKAFFSAGCETTMSAPSQLVDIDQVLEEQKSLTVPMTDVIAAQGVSGLDERDFIQRGSHSMAFVTTNKNPNEISVMPYHADGENMLREPHIVRKGESGTGKFETIAERLKSFTEFVTDPQGHPEDILVERRKSKFEQGPDMRAFTLTNSEAGKADLRVRVDDPGDSLGAELLKCSASPKQFWNLSVATNNVGWEAKPSKSGRQTVRSKVAQKILERAGPKRKDRGNELQVRQIQQH